MVKPHATPRVRLTQTTNHLGPIDACPGCGGHDFLLAEAGESVVFHCLGCDQGWRYELGYVWPVSAAAS